METIRNGELIKYRIVFKTGESFGSLAVIRVRLFGSNGKSKKIKLKISESDKQSLKGKTHVFALNICDIGEFSAVCVERDNDLERIIDFISIENLSESILHMFETPYCVRSSFKDTHTEKSYFWTARKFSNYKEISIFKAIKYNKFDILKEKLENSPSDITKTDSNGQSLLILACKYGHANIVRHLVNIYLKDEENNLIYMQTPFGKFSVHVCAENNHLDCIEVLYNAEASLDSETNEGNTPLHIAAISGNLDMVKWLVKHDARFKVFNHNNETALDLAIKKGHNEIINYLKELEPKQAKYASSESSYHTSASSDESDHDSDSTYVSSVYSD